MTNNDKFIVIKGERSGGKIYALKTVIRYQKAEIDRLQQNLKEAHIDIGEHLAEIEMLTNKCEDVHLEYDEKIGQMKKEAKIEAVREVGEKLKAIYGEWLYDFKVDDLVKNWEVEM